MSGKRQNIFISYSHHDAPLIDPLVKLLRASDSGVFQDIDSIKPGKKWRDEIDKGLSKAHMVFVLWCMHANESAEVKKEWKTAIELNKGIVPILVDDTPIPPDLGAFQGIDFKDAYGPRHRDIEELRSRRVTPPATPSPSPTARRNLLLGGALLVGASLVAGLAMSLLSPGANMYPPPLDVLLFLAAIAAILTWRGIRKVKQSMKHESVNYSRYSRASEFKEFDALVQRLAQQIEEEVVRRTGMKQDADAELLA